MTSIQIREIQGEKIQDGTHNECKTIYGNKFIASVMTNRTTRTLASCISYLYRYPIQQQ